MALIRLSFETAMMKRMWFTSCIKCICPKWCFKGFCPFKRHVLKRLLNESSRLIDLFSGTSDKERTWIGKQNRFVSSAAVMSEDQSYSFLKKCQIMRHKVWKFCEVDSVVISSSFFFFPLNRLLLFLCRKRYQLVRACSS